MPDQIIAAVLERYDCYSATYERELVKSMQRPAPPLSLAPGHPNAGAPEKASTISRRQRCYLLLSRDPGIWWTARDVALYLGEDRRAVHLSLADLVRMDVIRREKVRLGHGRQRYRAFESSLLGSTASGRERG
jgi:hypothetical protein